MSTTTDNNNMSTAMTTGNLSSAMDTESASTAMDINQIMEVLPHRPPFLLVDKLLECRGSQGVHGVKYLTSGEFFFEGHFPDQPVMPQTLLLEVTAQAGAVGVLSEPSNRGKYILFAAMDKCKFGRCPRPGDAVEIVTELISLKRGMGKVRARCFVGDEDLLDGLFVFALSAEV